MKQVDSVAKLKVGDIVKWYFENNEEEGHEENAYDISITTAIGNEVTLKTIGGDMLPLGDSGTFNSLIDERVVMFKLSKSEAVTYLL